jgi:hypothetical protein
MSRFSSLRFLVMLLSLAGPSTSFSATEVEPQPGIARTQQMPSIPFPLALRDWSQVTRDYLDLVFDQQAQGQHLPLINNVADDQRLTSFPSYVGGPRDPEAINYLAAVISGSLIGLDMQDYRGQDWVALSSDFFDVDEGVYINRLDSETGQSFWYDIFPNVLAYQVEALYPEEAAREDAALSIARKWQEACVALGGGSASLPNFDHTGLKLIGMQPVERGWIEPEAAAGIAWLEYMAWVKFKEPKFLTAADWAIRALEQRPLENSPLYEVLLPYGALAAARMNAELGRDYDVARLLNDCFEPRGRTQARPGWGVISDSWHGADMHGLVGSTTDGQGYAFAMNTFQWVGALAPIARYDTRYAHDIGKWILNVANAARMFYPNAHDEFHQSSHAWASSHDAKSAVAYEGIRKWKRGSALAYADSRTTGGRMLRGSFTSTHFRRESPSDAQTFEEDLHDGNPFEHIWEFEIPRQSERWLVVAAERIDGGHPDNEFRFSYSASADGPYTHAFSVAGNDPPQTVALPADINDKLYVKVEGNQPNSASESSDKLLVDAMAVSFQAEIGPFAQGDTVVTFVNLLNEATAPVVLYRPAAVTTDLGLYGSSHVGILGGIIKKTNVEAVLQLDLLKTDYFHGKAYPTYLYYNPCPDCKSIRIDVGPTAADLYDATNDKFLQCNVSGQTKIIVPADGAVVVVLAPAGGKLHREDRRTLIDDVVVRYSN